MTCGVEISQLPKIQQIAMVKRIASGKLKGITEIRAAVNTLIEREAQTEMLAAAPRANPEEMPLSLGWSARQGQPWFCGDRPSAWQRSRDA
jgi:hypothetical protein